MKKERVHLYLSESVKQGIQRLTQRPGELSAVAEELLQRGLSLKNGDILEIQALPAVRDIVQGELIKAVAQLRSDMREEMQTVRNDIFQEIRKETKESERRLGDRVAALVIRALREGLIIRRMLYALIAKGDPNFAQAAFEDARMKAGRDIAAKASDGAA